MLEKYSPSMQIARLVDKTVDAYEDPEKYINGAKGLYEKASYVASHPKETMDAVGNKIEEYFKEVDKDPYKRGMLEGRATMFVAFMFVGGGEAKVASKAGKGEEVLKVASKSKNINVANECKKLSDAKKISTNVRKGDKAFSVVDDVMIEGVSNADFYVGTDGTIAKDLTAYDSYTNDWILNKGYKPQPGERTLDGFLKNNISSDAELKLYTDSPGFNNNAKTGIGGEFKRFGANSHADIEPHVHQPIRNPVPNGDIRGDVGTKTKNGGVTSPMTNDIKQLLDYLFNGKYSK